VTLKGAIGHCVFRNAFIATLTARKRMGTGSSIGIITITSERNVDKLEYIAPNN
jgi:hypothetical protein